MLFLGLTACHNTALELQSPIGNEIKGTAIMFSQSYSGGGALSTSCSSAQISLHSLNSDSSINETAILSTLVRSDGSFSLTGARERGITFEKSNISYLLKASGCGINYYRPLTEYENQSITPGSTLLSYTIDVTDSSKKPLNQLSRADAKKAIENLDLVPSSSVTDLLDQVIAVPSLSTTFQLITHISPTKMNEIPPPYWSLTAPLRVNEFTYSSYSVNVAHWNKNYQAAYEWEFDGNVVSTSDAWTFNTSKNSQGLHQLILKVGTNNNGVIDKTKPIKTESMVVQVSNDFPAVIPGIFLVGSGKRNFLMGSVSIDTGALMSNCDTFSKLALTENPFVSPLASDFVIECTQAGVQNQPFIVSTGEGVKILSLWGIDSAGNISSLATTVSLILDQTNPSISLNSLASAIQGGNTLSVFYSAFDTIAGLESVTLEYAQDGTNFTILADLTNQVPPYLWSVPAVNIVGAKLRIRAVDQAGNSSQITSLSFAIDSTVPLISFSSPSANTSAQTGVTITGACETGIAINISGTGILSPLITSCSNSSFSQNIDFSTGEGSKNIVISQTDAAGHIGTNNRNFMRDNTGPSLSITSPVANSSFQSSFTATGACENGLNVNFSGTGLLSPSSMACSLGSYSKVLDFSNGEGNKSIAISQTDLAGNATSISQTLIRDNTAPSPLSWTSPAANTMAQNQISITLVCEGSLPLAFSGSGILSDFSVNCSNGSLTRNIFFSAGEETKTITVTQTDLAGNSSTITRGFVRDNTPPILTQTSVISPVITNQNTITFSGACESGLSIVVTGSDSSSISCNAGTWSYSVPAKLSDATYTHTFTITDAAGNQTALSTQYIRDTVAPALTYTGSSPFTTASNQFSFSGACESGRTISISGTDTSSTTCSGGVWSYTSAPQTTDGSRTYSFAQTDVAGNTTTQSATWERNTVGPALTINQNTTQLNNQNSTTFTGGCENGLNIIVSGTDSTSTTCNNGSWTYTTSNQTTDALRSYSFTQTNGLSVSTSVTGLWRRDSIGPILSQLQINNGVATTSSRFVAITLQSTDSNSKITSFCLKINSSATPTSTDSCWIPVNSPSPGVTPATSISFSGYQYALDLADDTYTVYAWTRDELGNISTLTASGIGTAGIDKASIQQLTGQPAAINTITIANTDAPSNPILSSEQVVTAGQNVYIKWKITDTQAIPGNGISIYFTTNESDNSPSAWTLLSPVEGLSDANNGGCTLSGSDTGCFLFSAPTASYFRVQLRVTNASGYETRSLASPMNSTPFTILAGNTEIGIGGSGKSAIFQHDLSGNARFAEKQALIVTNDGTIYFRDYKKGILKVNATDSKVDLFLPTTGTSSGDNGPVTNATLKQPNFIALDYQNRMLIFDYNKIRRVDLNVTPATITTIIGGGVSTADTINNPLDLLINNLSAYNDRNAKLRNFLIPAPNGDLYFYSDPITPTAPYPATNKRVRIYRATTSEIQSLYLSGTGHAEKTTLDLTSSYCGNGNWGFAFNLSTGALEHLRVLISNRYYASGDTQCSSTGPIETIGDVYTRLNPITGIAEGPHFNGGVSDRTYTTYTGMDGKIYIVNREAGTVTRFNHDPTTATAGTITTLAGTGTAGYCDDDTPALSCNMNPQSIFVTQTGQVYFTEHGLIRTITTANKIKTIYGQSNFYGDGGPASLARFALTQSLDIHFAGGNKVVVYDGATRRIREFTVGGNITTLAGDSRSADANTTSPASTQPLPGQSSFLKDHITVDRTNGNIYAQYATHLIGKLNRATGKWERIYGGGTTDFTLNDNNLATSANNTAFVSSQGIGGGQLMIGTAAANPSPGQQKDLMYKLIDLTTLTQTHLAGILENPATFGLCANGTLSASCVINSWPDSAMNSTYDAANSRWLFGIATATGIYSVGVGLNKTTVVNLPRGIETFAYKQSTGTFFYCAQDGRLYKWTTSESQMILPNSSILCQGNSLIYDSNRNVLIFPFTQNGLWGIGEYANP